MAAVEYSPVDLRVMFLCRMGLIRPLTPEEQLELAQIDAAEKAERAPQEQLQ
ncbi:hypothetical protein [Roseateles sp.]|uniref:hypothetical protein n=1 Tax=Roseateles sp. TaxID=1971397 RepID=UPI00394424CF